MARRLTEQGGRRLAERLRRLASFYTDLQHQRAVQDRAAFLDRHAERLNYLELIARGLPVDFGVIESLCKQIGTRLKSGDKQSKQPLLSRDSLSRHAVPKDAKRWAAELWRERIEVQRVSRMSIRAWSRYNDVHEQGFYWWRTRLRLSPAGTRRPGSSGAGPVNFAEIVDASPVIAKPLVVSQAERIQLQLRGQRELILPTTMPVADVGALVLERVDK